MRSFIFISLAIFVITGCAAKMGSTRSLPLTQYPQDINVSNALKILVISMEPFDVTRTDISGGHHEGLAQVRQPWIFGLSGEQKEAMYSDLRNVVRYAFIHEFIKLGISVDVPEEHVETLGMVAKKKEIRKPPTLKITGNVKSVEMNTYGRGLSGRFEGYGSAGNYWEANIVLTNISVYDVRKDKILWQGEITKYCKMANSPIKLDWTMFTLLSKSLAMGAVGGGVQGKIKSVESFAGDYHIESIDRNPVEIAARIAAHDLIQTIGNVIAAGE
jgi:hypothetical protein